MSPRNLHLYGLFAIIFSRLPKLGDYHFALPILVSLIGVLMVACGLVLFSQLTSRQEAEIVKLQNQIEGQDSETEG